jgi:NTP pyrophosphatase (non-canonical NTP hydrolase)
MQELQNIMNSIAEWSDATFGDKQRNPALLHHLKKEVSELIEAIEKYELHKKVNYKKHHSFKTTAQNKLEENVFEEYADCMMLLLDSAHHFGISSFDLARFIHKKLEINKARIWGKPDENGVVEHIRENYEQLF